MPDVIVTYAVGHHRGMYDELKTRTFYDAFWRVETSGTLHVMKIVGRAGFALLTSIAPGMWQDVETSDMEKPTPLVLTTSHDNGW